MATSVLEHAHGTAHEKTGLWSWITTVDHTRIGILYGATAFLFFLLGGLEALLSRSRGLGVFGTKERSVINLGNRKGIAAIVAQQLEVARQVLDAGLVPIIEPSEWPAKYTWSGFTARPDAWSAAWSGLSACCGTPAGGRARARTSAD